MAYKLIKSSFYNAWPSLVIICMTLITVRVAYLMKHKNSFCFHKEFWGLVSIVYMIMLYELVTRVDINELSGVNLVPFAQIMKYEFGSRIFYYNVVGNILLFVPFGLIVAGYIKPNKIWTNTFIALFVSLTIELVQSRIGRCFDIDDVILNTLGCIIGFLLYVGKNAAVRHLPGFIKSDWFNNLICIIISICIIIYVIGLLGYKVGL